MTNKYTKISLGLLVVILIALQHRLWFGENGLRTVKLMEHELTAQKQENEKLRERNRVLEAEVSELKQGLDSIEERARSELGMIKPGEKFYFLANPSSVTSAPLPPRK